MDFPTVLLNLLLYVNMIPYDVPSYYSYLFQTSLELHVTFLHYILADDQQLFNLHLK